jgi:hypothetical protein
LLHVSYDHCLLAHSHPPPPGAPVRYLEYLYQTKKDAVNSSKASRLQRVTSSSSSINGNQPTSWDGFQTAASIGGGSSSSQLLQRSESLEDALVAVSGSGTLRRRRQQRQAHSSGSSSPRWPGLQDREEPGFWGGYDSPRAAGGSSGGSLFDFLLPGGEEEEGEDGMTPADALRRQRRQQQLLQQHLAAEPVFALARLQFGKQQVRESIPVRLRPGGAAVFREQFVFTTKRPLQNKRLVMEVRGRCDSTADVCTSARQQQRALHMLCHSGVHPFMNRCPLCAPLKSIFCMKQFFQLKMVAFTSLRGADVAC